MNLNQNGANFLLNMVSKKLGTNSNQLKKDLQSGDLSRVTKNMSPEESKKLNRALTDKDFAQKIFSSPEAQALMKKLSGKK